MYHFKWKGINFDINLQAERSRMRLVIALDIGTGKVQLWSETKG
jgi:hypothetical protein